MTPPPPVRRPSGWQRATARAARQEREACLQVVQDALSVWRGCRDREFSSFAVRVLGIVREAIAARGLP